VLKDQITILLELHQLLIAACEMLPVGGPREKYLSGSGLGWVVWFLVYLASHLLAYEYISGDKPHLVVDARVKEHSMCFCKKTFLSWNKIQNN
jgi:hypothetical protein